MVELPTQFFILNKEVPILASKYRKNYAYDHAIDKVVDGKHADLMARIWGAGEEVFVGVTTWAT